MSLVKTNSPDYMKDRATGMIINTNDVEYQRILAARKAESKGQALEERVTNVENTLTDIKDLLQQILAQSSKDPNG